MSIKLMTMVWDVTFPTQSQKLIALKMADYASDHGGSIFPAVNTVAKHAGCDERTAQRVLKAFISVGFIALVKSGGRGPRATNRWQIDIEMLTALSRGDWVLAGDGKSLLLDKSKGDILSGNPTGGTPSGDELRVTPVSAKGDTGVTQTYTNHQHSKTVKEAEQKAAIDRVVREGLGKGGLPTAQTRLKVAARLAIVDPEPLVRLYAAWSGSKGARDADALFLRTADRFYRDAPAAVRSACRPLANETAPLPTPPKPARPSAALLAALQRKHPRNP